MGGLSGPFLVVASVALSGTLPTNVVSGLTGFETPRRKPFLNSGGVVNGCLVPENLGAIAKLLFVSAEILEVTVVHLLGSAGLVIEAKLFLKVKCELAIPFATISGGGWFIFPALVLPAFTSASNSI